MTDVRRISERKGCDELFEGAFCNGGIYEDGIWEDCICKDVRGDSDRLEMSKGSERNVTAKFARMSAVRMSDVSLRIKYLKIMDVRMAQ